MAREIKLKNNIKFRRENNYILLCDCKNLEDYELSLEYLSFLIELDKGICQDKIKDKELIEDLIKIKALDF